MIRSSRSTSIWFLAGFLGCVVFGPSLRLFAQEKSATPAYEGTKSCKKCHLPVEKSWAETKHAHAMETLKPGQAVEAKSKFKLDPNKDYTQDTGCLMCHTTGYGRAGGYALPAADDAKAVKAAAKFENVGCESCHGPGSVYTPVFEEITKSGRKYKLDELRAAGLSKIEASTCTTCHNNKSPTYDASQPFDFVKMSERGVHAHEPLKQRE